MESFLILGFLVGMSHALEADHLAAVGAMASGRNSARRLAFMGAAWGLGHTVTLFLLCSAVILFGYVLTDHAAAALELAVGVMLVVLGGKVLYRMIRSKIHFHVHDHGDGQPHIHAHSHAQASGAHSQDAHEHQHPPRLPIRALMVGLIHGAAGSAALLALALAASREPWLALAYVAVFGIGSICGMAMLTFVVAWPMKFAERSARWLHGRAHAAIGMVAIALGGMLIVETLPVALELI
ncbi:MAG: urease accessory protein [Hyphomicrobiales bacterium]|nr:urease accessory protein [Hyphomicrobiales bacterium]